MFKTVSYQWDSTYIIYNAVSNRWNHRHENNIIKINYIKQIYFVSKFDKVLKFNNFSFILKIYVNANNVNFSD